MLKIFYKTCSIYDQLATYSFVLEILLEHRHTNLLKCFIFFAYPSPFSHQKDCMSFRFWYIGIANV